jgi:hypothetical protein
MVAEELEGRAGKQETRFRPSRTKPTSQSKVSVVSDGRTALQHIAYVENNKDRMLYGTYRKLGLFYGSSVVEAGCKTVIGQRLKNSGMFWTTAGALNVAILRYGLLDDRFDQYWDQRNHTDRFRIKLAA